LIGVSVEGAVVKAIADTILIAVDKDHFTGVSCAVVVVIGLIGVSVEGAVVTDVPYAIIIEVELA
jgi:hypothetical protein